MSQGYDDHLQKVGQYWHYRFRVNGHTFRGSTKCKSRVDALAFVQACMVSAGLEEMPLLIRLGLHFRPSLGSTRDYAKVPDPDWDGQLSMDEKKFAEYIRSLVDALHSNVDDPTDE